jgi:hypothetical protein
MAEEIIKLLVDTGNEWRQVTWEEYNAVYSPGKYSGRDEWRFNKVIEYCTSAEKARTFCPGWEYDAETAYSYARFV